MGRVWQEQRTVGNATGSINYTYNKDGSVWTVQTPPLKTITYVYNGAAHPISAEDNTDNINFVTGATYAPPGELSGFTNGSSISGAVTYNSRLQPMQLYFTNGTISTTTLN
jgi:hypothetical protein